MFARLSKHHHHQLRERLFSTLKPGQLKRPVVSSECTKISMIEPVLPSDTHPRGYLLGGPLLCWIDLAAALSCKKLVPKTCVTASVDAVHFIEIIYENRKPVMLGDIAILNAQVTRTWNTSMEVKVQVKGENMKTGEQTNCCQGGSCEYGNHPLPIIQPFNENSHLEFNGAQERRAYLFNQRDQQLKNNSHSLLQQQLLKYSTTINNSNVGNNNKEITPRDTFTETSHFVFPEHVNPVGVTFGGQIMRWMHRVAWMAASRLARSDQLLIASTDQLFFLNPTRAGDVITVRGIVTRGFNTSLEVYVVSETTRSDNPLDSQLCNEAFVTFVAKDLSDDPKSGDLPYRGLRPALIRKLVPETEVEQEVWKEAEIRRKHRLLSKSK